MIKANNTVILSGGLTRDPEMENNDSLVHFGLAVDGAGREKDVKYPAGYFDVKFWLTDSKFSATAAVEDVKSGLSNGTLKKGTRIQVVGSLVQERWTKDGQKFSKIVVMAESISFYAGGNTNAATTAAAPAQTFDASQF